MKLIVYETSHYEILPGLLKLAGPKFAHIQVFLPRTCYEQLSGETKLSGSNANIQFTIQEPGLANRAFIRKLFNEIQHGQFTHLHVSTLDHNVFYFALQLLKCSNLQISITIHSINEYFGNYMNGFKAFTETVGKFILRRKIKHYRVLVPNMVEYFKTKSANAQVVYLPGDFFIEDHSPIKNVQKSISLFTLLIPGSVEKKRRDYEGVIRFLRKELDNLIDLRPIKLVLGGKSDSEYGREIVKQFQQIEHDLFKVEFSKDELIQADYQHLFYEADIVWNPIPIETVNKSGYTEFSGISHSPGFFTDQLRFGCCAILSARVPCPPKLKPGNYFYENEHDLLSIFEEIMGNPEMLIKKKLAMEIICHQLNADYFESDFLELIGQKVAG